MKIQRIEHFLVPPRWVFVRIETENAVGWGEASLEGNGAAVCSAIDTLAQRLVGQDARRIEDCWQVGYRGGFYRGGPVLMSALSGIDQALWDLKGQHHGMPAYEMLGGAVRDRVKAYAWIGGDKPQDVSSAARDRRKQGFTAVKMNATSEVGLVDFGEFDDVVERVEAVQAEGLSVGIDFHGRLSKAAALRLAKRLDDCGAMFFEEPVLSENGDALARIAGQVSTPIALGERLYSRWDFKPFFENGTIDIAQPDLSHAGGLSECRRIAAMAEAYDVAVAPHCPLGPLALGACLQLAACASNVVLQEMSLGIHYNQGHDLHSFMRDPKVLTPVEGYLPIPSGPGLGIAINEEGVRAAAREPHRWQNPIWRHADGSFAEW